MIEYLTRFPEWRSDIYKGSAPDEGLLIWHVGNERALIRVEQADGLFQLENGGKGSDGDLFHAGYKTAFNDDTLPNARWWNGERSGLRISNIGELGGRTMRLSVGKGGPNYLPPEVTVASVSESDVKLKWKSIAGVSTYIVYVRKEDGSWFKLGDNISGTSKLITGLDADTQYYFDVYYEAPNGSYPRETVSVTTRPFAGAYKIINVNSGMAISGSGLIQSPYQDDPWMLWSLAKSPDGYYWLTPQHALGKRLDTNPYNGDLLSLFDAAGWDRQKFRVEAVGNDEYVIRNMGGGKCIQIQGASLSEGAPIVMKTYNETSYQTFRIEKVYDAMPDWMELINARTPTDGSWQTVSFTKTYTSPIVVASPLSFSVTDPAHIRIKNVTSTGFEYLEKGSVP